MRSHSLDVETVEKDGRQIMDAITHIQPDVVMMDFFLPHLDAIGVMKGIRASHPVHAPQFMVMSSYDNPNLEREAMQAGADYYIFCLLYTSLPYSPPWGKAPAAYGSAAPANTTSTCGRSIGGFSRGPA